MLETLAVLASNITNVPVVVSTGTSIPDLIQSIVNQMGTTIIAISGLLGTPGIIALFNYFKRGSQRAASEELLGVLGQKVIGLSMQVKQLTEAGIALAPKDTQIQIQNQQELLAELDAKLKTLNDEISRIKPKLPSTTRAAITHV